jgi:hypothetical protein|tara:strand:+ start:996 stop:1370 length:375 start_codon:yes stop_codon:yes gene_type:complete
MKKLLLFTLSLLVLSCAKDLDYDVVEYTIVPEKLVIAEDAGLRLASNIVHGNVDINVKLPSAGTYRIRVLDLTNRIVSQDKIQAPKGDNILKVYVSTLPDQSYTVELLTLEGASLGRDVFAIQQ